LMDISRTTPVQLLLRILLRHTNIAFPGSANFIAELLVLAGIMIRLSRWWGRQRAIANNGTRQNVSSDADRI